MSLLNAIQEQEEKDVAPRRDQGGAILSVDIGNIYTRAILLDMVDGAYRFVARGEAPTTAAPPWNNVMEGIHQAVKQIADATGRAIFDDDGSLIMPERDLFYGVNVFTATASAGKPVRAILVGLMPDVSLSSGRRAAESAYLMLVDSFSLGDKRTQEQQINAVLQAQPELVLIVGGTDNGAAQSIRRQVETIALACTLMERERRPTILFAGNQAMRGEVEEKFDEVGVRTLLADNVRPTLETESLDQAQKSLASLYHKQRASSAGGFAEIGGWTDDGVFPTAHGFSRMIQILGAMESQNVLGVDLGSSDTTIAAYLRGHHYLNVEDGLGVGHTATGILSHIKPDNIARWLSYAPEHPDDVQDYVWNKWLFPQTVPVSREDLELECGLAREIIRFAALSARASWRDVRQRGPLPPFDTILLAGSTLARAPHYGWAALVALDAFLPIGVTRLVVDPYGMAAALGSIAPFNHRAVVQTLETGAFIDLGTVIAVSGRARKGEIVLRGSLKPEGESQAETFEVAYGSIARIPLEYGKAAEVTLQPRNVEIEAGPRKRLRKLKVRGGELGMIIDARGRPWRFPREPEERRALVGEWIASMTGDQ